MEIQLHSITKSYKEPVIKDLSYTFETGKLYVIKGVSGCGKTTLLNLIGGIDSASSGTVENNFDVKLSQHTGYIFQNSMLISGITVSDNLLLIKNDSKEIWRLSRMLGVEDLLSKDPSQISGGERQRIAIVRALMQSPRLLLADEPTASLDDENSRHIAEILAKLKSAERILIVATHEHYFDDYADEIVHLNYGVIEKVEQKTPVLLSSEEREVRSAPRGKKRLSAFRFALKRNPRLLRSGGIFLMALVFLALMVLLAVKENFSDMYVQSIRTQYCWDLVSLDSRIFDWLSCKDRLDVYDKYTAKEGDYVAFHLLDEKDSVLALEGMLKEGRFPKNEHEILVNGPFVTGYFGENFSAASAIGQKVVFKGVEFTVSGVVRDGDDEKFKTMLSEDIYYPSMKDFNDSKLLFISYDVLKTIGDKDEGTVFILCVCDGLYEDEEVQEELLVNSGSTGGSLGTYYKLYGLRNRLNYFTYVFLAVFFAVYIMFCIFMTTIVQTELFYRKKELGYLQIFGVNKRKILRFLLCEYFLKIFFSFVLSVVCYILIVLIYTKTFSALVIPNFRVLVPIFLLIFAIYLATVYFCSLYFLRKKVISLIV